MSIESGPSLELLTIPEVARLLKISVPSVRRLQQQRRNPFFQSGWSHPLRTKRYRGVLAEATDALDRLITNDVWQYD